MSESDERVPLLRVTYEVTLDVTAWDKLDKKLTALGLKRLSIVVVEPEGTEPKPN